MKVVILAMIKNEHRYLDEWLQYHLSKGFDHIYLVEDLNSNSHRRITLPYGDKVSIHRCKRDLHIELHGVERQVRIYNKFFKEYLKLNEETWCAFLDMDEFFCIKESMSLQDLVSNKTSPDSVNGMRIFLNNFFASNRIFEPSKVFGSYSNGVFDLDGKRGLRNKIFCRVDTPYRFDFIQGARCTADLNSNLLHKCDDCPTNVAWINHYFTKSWEGWLYRMKRGTQVTERSPDFRRLEDFFKYNEDMAYLKEYLINNYTSLKDEWLQQGKFLPDTYKDDLKNLGYDIKYLES